MIFQILLADKVIELNTTYSLTSRLCRNYICQDQVPDIRIEIQDVDIKSERELSRKSDMEEGREPVSYSDAYLESLAVYRKIADRMIKEDTLLMHGSVVTAPVPSTEEPSAIMFTARSGVGKTTRTMMWLEKVPGSFIVNGDKPLLKVADSQVIACGTPWCGKEYLQTNCKVPLKAIFILERAEKNLVEEISMSDALPFLLTQIYRPKDSMGMIQTLKLIKAMSGKVRFFRFMSNLEDEAVQLAYQAVFEKE